MRQHAAWRSAAALVLTAALCAAMLSVLSSEARASTLFSDDFESYSDFPASPWVNASGNGSWGIAVEEGSQVARQHSTASGTYILTTGDPGVGNYRAAAAVRIDSTSVRNGLVARYRDGNNFYFLILYNGEVRLNAKVSGSTTVLDTAPFAADPSVYHRLELEVDGSGLRGYVDGTLLVQGTEPELSGGAFGFYSNGAVSYDDVLVTAEGPGPEPTPTITPTPTADPSPTRPGHPPTPGSCNQLPVADVAASDHDGNVPPNATDYDLQTRWSAEGNGQWIQFDLVAARTLCHVEIAFYRGDERRAEFAVQASANGHTWTTVFDGRSSGDTEGFEVIDIDDQVGRHLRIVGYGNTQNAWNSISEVRIHGGVAIESSPTATPTDPPDPTATPTDPTPSPTPTDTDPPGDGRTINVSTSAELTSALTSAVAGDRIVLANGGYSMSKVTGRHGTAEAPIVVEAAERSGAVVTEGQLEILDSSYLTIAGLSWRNSSTLKIDGSHHVRLTRNHFRLAEQGSLKWVIIQGEGSHHNRIDHNLFEDKQELGNFITIDGSATQQSQFDRIDHNHFRDIGPRAQNEMEAIRVGWSALSRSSGYTLVEHNLFENADGDPEIVSVKSSDNIVRYNTFRTSQGVLSARHGDRNRFDGNFFLGEGKPGTGGIRLYGSDHVVVNNYFEGLTGSGYDAALQIDGGDIDTSGALSAHWRVYRATVAFNTFVDNASTIEIGTNYPLPPVDSMVAYNLLTGTDGALIAENSYPVNMTYVGNIAHPTGSATVGITAGPEEVRVADPLLVAAAGLWRLGGDSPAIGAAGVGLDVVTDDMDGHDRTAPMDVGADEYSPEPPVRGPLTASQVGPDAL
jgi:hypothetical protein